MRHGVCWLGAAPACALMLAAAACGSQATRPEAGGSAAASPAPSVSPSASASAGAPGSPSPASSGPAAIPAAMLNAVTGGSSGSSARIHVVTSPGSVLAHPAASQAAALHTALAQEPPGSKVLGMSLARVEGFGFGSDMARSQLAWLVSTDPYGGAYGAGGTLGCGRITYDVEFIDPGTGEWLMAAAGRQPGMPPLPILGPTPALAQPSPSCGVPNGHMHQGTPAAY